MNVMISGVMISGLVRILSRNRSLGTIFIGISRGFRAFVTSFKRIRDFLTLNHHFNLWLRSRLRNALRTKAFMFVGMEGHVPRGLFERTIHKFAKHM